MNQATHDTHSKIPPSHPAWAQLDNIHTSKGTLIQLAADSIDAAIASLASTGPTSRATLASLLAYAVRDLRAADGFLSNAVVLMSGVSLDDQ